MADIEKPDVGDRNYLAKMLFSKHLGNNYRKVIGEDIVSDTTNRVTLKPVELDISQTTKLTSNSHAALCGLQAYTPDNYFGQAILTQQDNLFTYGYPYTYTYDGYTYKGGLLNENSEWWINETNKAKEEGNTALLRHLSNIKPKQYFDNETGKYITVTYPEDSQRDNQRLGNFFNDNSTSTKNYHHSSWFSKSTTSDIAGYRVNIHHRDDTDNEFNQDYIQVNNIRNECTLNKLMSCIQLSGDTNIPLKDADGDTYTILQVSNSYLKYPIFIIEDKEYSYDEALSSINTIPDDIEFMDMVILPGHHIPRICLNEDGVVVPVNKEHANITSLWDPYSLLVNSIRYGGSFNPGKMLKNDGSVAAMGSGMYTPYNSIAAGWMFDTKTGWVINGTGINGNDNYNNDYNIINPSQIADNKDSSLYPTLYLPPYQSRHPLSFAYFKSILDKVKEDGIDLWRLFWRFAEDGDSQLSFTNLGKHSIFTLVHSTDIPDSAKCWYKMHALVRGGIDISKYTNGKQTSIYDLFKSISDWNKFEASLAEAQNSIWFIQGVADKRWSRDVEKTNPYIDRTTDIRYEFNFLPVRNDSIKSTLPVFFGDYNFIYHGSELTTFGKFIVDSGEPTANEYTFDSAWVPSDNGLSSSTDATDLYGIKKYILNYVNSLSDKTEFINCYRRHIEAQIVNNRLTYILSQEDFIENSTDDVFSRELVDSITGGLTISITSSDILVTMGNGDTISFMNDVQVTYMNEEEYKNHLTSADGLDSETYVLTEDNTDRIKHLYTGGVNTLLDDIKSIAGYPGIEIDEVYFQLRSYSSNMIDEVYPFAGNQKIRLYSMGVTDQKSILPAYTTIAEHGNKDDISLLSTTNVTSLYNYNYNVSRFTSKYTVPGGIYNYPFCKTTFKCSPSVNTLSDLVSSYNFNTVTSKNGFFKNIVENPGPDSLADADLQHKLKIAFYRLASTMSTGLLPHVRWNIKERTDTVLDHLTRVDVVIKVRRPFKDSDIGSVLMSHIPNTNQLKHLCLSVNKETGLGNIGDVFDKYPGVTDIPFYSYNGRVYIPHIDEYKVDEIYSYDNRNGTGLTSWSTKDSKYTNIPNSIGSDIISYIKVHGNIKIGNPNVYYYKDGSTNELTYIGTGSIRQAIYFRLGIGSSYIDEVNSESSIARGVRTEYTSDTIATYISRYKKYIELVYPNISSSELSTLVSDMTDKGYWISQKRQYITVPHAFNYYRGAVISSNQRNYLGMLRRYDVDLSVSDVKSYLTELGFNIKKIESFMTDPFYDCEMMDEIIRYYVGPDATQEMMNYFEYNWTIYQDRWKNIIKVFADTILSWANTNGRLVKDRVFKAIKINYKDESFLITKTRTNNINSIVSESMLFNNERSRVFYINGLTGKNSTIPYTDVKYSIPNNTIADRIDGKYFDQQNGEWVSTDDSKDYFIGDDSKFYTFSHYTEPTTTSNIYTRKDVLYSIMYTTHSNIIYGTRSFMSFFDHSSRYTALVEKRNAKSNTSTGYTEDSGYSYDSDDFHLDYFQNVPLYITFDRKSSMIMYPYFAWFFHPGEEEYIIEEFMTLSGEKWDVSTSDFAVYFPPTRAGMQLFYDTLNSDYAKNKLIEIREKYGLKEIMDDSYFKSSIMPGALSSATTRRLVYNLFSRCSNTFDDWYNKNLSSLPAETAANILELFEYIDTIKLYIMDYVNSPCNNRGGYTYTVNSTNTQFGNVFDVGFLQWLAFDTLFNAPGMYSADYYLRSSNEYPSDYTYQVGEMKAIYEVGKTPHSSVISDIPECQVRQPAYYRPSLSSLRSIHQLSPYKNISNNCISTYILAYGPLYINSNGALHSSNGVYNNKDVGWFSIIDTVMELGCMQSTSDMDEKFRVMFPNQVWSKYTNNKNINFDSLTSYARMSRFNRYLSTSNYYGYTSIEDKWDRSPAKYFNLTTSTVGAFYKNNYNYILTNHSGYHYLTGYNLSLSHFKNSNTTLNRLILFNSSQFDNITDAKKLRLNYAQPSEYTDMRVLVAHISNRFAYPYLGRFVSDSDYRDIEFTNKTGTSLDIIKAKFSKFKKSWFIGQGDTNRTHLSFKDIHIFTLNNLVTDVQYHENYTDTYIDGILENTYYNTYKVDVDNYEYIPPWLYVFYFKYNPYLIRIDTPLYFTNNDGEEISAIEYGLYNKYCMAELLPALVNGKFTVSNITDNIPTFEDILDYTIANMPYFKKSYWLTNMQNTTAIYVSSAVSYPNLYSEELHGPKNIGNVYWPQVKNTDITIDMNVVSDDGVSTEYSYLPKTYTNTYQYRGGYEPYGISVVLWHHIPEYRARIKAMREVNYTIFHTMQDYHPNIAVGYMGVPIHQDLQTKWLASIDGGYRLFSRRDGWKDYLTYLSTTVRDESGRSYGQSNMPLATAFMPYDPLQDVYKDGKIPLGELVDYTTTPIYGIPYIVANPADTLKSVIAPRMDLYSCLEIDDSSGKVSFSNMKLYYDPFYPVIEDGHMNCVMSKDNVDLTVLNELQIEFYNYVKANTHYLVNMQSYTIYDTKYYYLELFNPKGAAKSYTTLSTEVRDKLREYRRKFALIPNVNLPDSSIPGIREFDINTSMNNTPYLLEFDVTGSVLNNNKVIDTSLDHIYQNDKNRLSYSSGKHIKVENHYRTVHYWTDTEKLTFDKDTLLSKDTTKYFTSILREQKYINHPLLVLPEITNPYVNLVYHDAIDALDSSAYETVGKNKLLGLSSAIIHYHGVTRLSTRHDTFGLGHVVLDTIAQPHIPLHRLKVDDTLLSTQYRYANNGTEMYILTGMNIENSKNTGDTISEVHNSVVSSMLPSNTYMSTIINSAISSRVYNQSYTQYGRQFRDRAMMGIFLTLRTHGKLPSDLVDFETHLKNIDELYRQDRWLYDIIATYMSLMHGIEMEGELNRSLVSTVGVLNANHALYKSGSIWAVTTSMAGEILNMWDYLAGYFPRYQVSNTPGRFIMLRQTYTYGQRTWLNILPTTSSTVQANFKPRFNMDGFYHETIEDKIYYNQPYYEIDTDSSDTSYISSIINDKGYINIRLIHIDQIDPILRHLGITPGVDTDRYSFITMLTEAECITRFLVPGNNDKDNLASTVTNRTNNGVIWYKDPDSDSQSRYDARECEPMWLLKWVLSINDKDGTPTTYVHLYTDDVIQYIASIQNQLSFYIKDKL